MENHIYKKIEITGTSPNSIEDAVNNALERASKSIKHMRWFEVTETRGDIDGGKVRHWQVTMKVGFTLQDTTSAPDSDESSAEKSRSRGNGGIPVEVD